MLGVTPQYQHIRNLIVTEGRFFDDTDDTAHIQCAVVTQQFAKERYGSDDAAIGQTFEILGIPFTIIGVFKESVSDFGQSEITDETVLVPYYGGALLYRNRKREPDLLFHAEHERGARRRERDCAGDQVSGTGRTRSTRHKRSADLLVTAAKIADALTAVLVLVAAVTLAVGGVGIMNIMLANVRSRIREIGIRKALGATYREIKLQFLTEAVLISLTGGIVGSLVGLALPFPSASSPATTFPSRGCRC